MMNDSRPKRRWFQFSLRALLLGLLVLSGCGPPKEQQAIDAYNRGVDHAEKGEPDNAIPEDVKYTIIDQHIIPGIKRGLDVRLNRKVSEDVLRAIALQLKNSDPRTYKRTFIHYYLPEVEGGAWAATDFDPDLEVRVFGLTVEQEQALRKLAEVPGQKAIGHWLNETPHYCFRLTIFRQRGSLFMEETHPDGSSGKEELVEKPSSKGRKFEYKDGKPFGVYYLIDKQGHLQVWDQDGFGYTATEILKGPPRGGLHQKEYEFRAWTDNTGKHSIEAKFLSYGVGKVTLEKRNGSKTTLPVERLSPEDQEWVKGLLP